ncbi:B2 protein [Vitis vinifera]|uniref:B2 protein n=1 Tax=Vitis vinifera TaxID=29760 RepID=A0A438J565_VITVI|nr:B2 protein [Vitis vinifera]
MEGNQQSFWQFSDQLRVQTSNLANLSLNESIWSSPYTKRQDERRNFDIRVGGEINPGSSLKQKGLDFNGGYDMRVGGEINSGSSLKQKVLDFNGGYEMRVGGEINSGSSLKQKGSDFNGGYEMMVGREMNSVNDLRQKGNDYNGFNGGWKIGVSPFMGGAQSNVGVNGGFNKGVYSKPGNYVNSNINVKNGNNKNGNYKGEDEHGVKVGKKNKGNKNNNNNNNNDGDNNSNGLPPRYRDSVRAITPGLPLFLYNYSTHQLHGVLRFNIQHFMFWIMHHYLMLYLYVQAASFGGTNIDPTAWEDKKCPGESRFPAQVRVVTRKICEPMEEDSFRPVLHHYDGPKFRLELNVPEALSLLDIFNEKTP